MSPRKILAYFNCLIAGALFLIFIAPEPVYSEQWSSPTWMSELNSPARDLEPWVSADGKTLYFSSDRAGGPDMYKLDIYVSHLINGHWTTPEALPPPLNDPTARDGHPSLTLDGRYMYFHSSRAGGMGDQSYENGLDIWVSENIDGQWQTPVNLGPNINTPLCDKEPFISVDGQNLYFSSGDSFAKARDLMVSHKVNGVFQPAVNMGSTINSSTTNDVHPNLSYTGRFLFFSRGGLGTGVPTDIWRAERIAGVWQTPVLLPRPPNSSYDDESTIFNDCTNTLWLYSDGQAFWDIGTSQWLDFPDPNPCQKLIIPDGQWRVRVTLLEASAGLSSDIYIDQPISQLLIKKSLRNVGTVVSTPFLSAEELVFRIHVHGQSLGLGEYDHYSNSQFARVTRTDPLRYIVGFEDLPADMADWDYNDTVLLVELVGVEVNIWEGQNYLGETQLVEEATPAQTTTLDMPLSRGAAVDASVSIPGGEINGPAYAILTQGEPVLYEEAVQDAPFISTGDFIKFELTNGQNQLNGEPAQVSITYKDEDNDGFVDGTALRETELAVYHLDPESSTWEELPSQVYPDNNTVTAQTNNFSLFALGGKMPQRMDEGGRTHNESVNDGMFGCWLAYTKSTDALANAMLLLLIMLLPAAVYRLSRGLRA